jgi:hypothetical protein
LVFGSPNPITPAMAVFVVGSVAASTDSPAPSDTPIRIGFREAPRAAQSASTL